MPPDANPAPGGEPRDALNDALAELRDDVAQAPGETAERYWLRVGLGLGLRRPGRAQLLLERLEGGLGAAGSLPVAGARTTTDRPDAPLDAPPDSGAAAAAETDDDEPPIASMLLVRAAALPLDEPPETAFGWALRLRADEITRMGRVADEMIADGARRDLARGFAIAWNGGVKLPANELNQLFGRFTDLVLTVASVLSGHDIRESAERTKPSLSEVVQGWFMPRSGPGADEAGAVLARLGDPAQHGLIAAWNAWAAVRYRSVIPDALYEELTSAWVTVVGRLPEG